MNQNSETPPSDSLSGIVSRRDSIRLGVSRGSLLAAGLTLASVPAAIAALARSAAAQAAPSLIDVLNYALTLEYLEDEFYRTGLASPVAAAFSVAERMSVQEISNHEMAHVAFLRTVIMSFQGTPVAKPTFDFTARGAFPDVFSNKTTFLAVAQAFEDTGVRAYKGQAGNVMANDTVLTAALQIHAVEARHASQIRRLRGQKGWITGSERGGLPPQVQAVYEGEANTMQAGQDAAPLGSDAGGGAAVTEAFDEPLGMQQVLSIVRPFLAG